MYNYGKIVKLLFWRKAKEWDWLVREVKRQACGSQTRCEVSEMINGQEIQAVVALALPCVSPKADGSLYVVRC